MADVIESIVVASAPETVYDFVSDVTRMGEWSPETRACRWLGGATGPAVGAQFRGVNRDRWRRWSSRCTVTAAERGRSFGFDVTYGPLRIAHWQYDIEPADGGCVVREIWTDHRGGWLRAIYPYATGVRDRGEHNRTTMRATLAALKRAAESAAAAG